jgi:hypothetical protein
MVGVAPDNEQAQLRSELDRLRTENARLARLLELRGQDTSPAAEQMALPTAPGAAAMLDALAYAKAARVSGVPAAVELSKSGRGAHVWVFFAAPVEASTARAMGTVLLHEAMVLRGSMDLRSYDRLFPNQDVLPDAGYGNLIAAPLQEAP